MQTEQKHLGCAGCGCLLIVIACFVAAFAAVSGGLMFVGAGS